MITAQNQLFDPFLQNRVNLTLALGILTGVIALSTVLWKGFTISTATPIALAIGIGVVLLKAIQEDILDTLLYCL